MRIIHLNGRSKKRREKEGDSILSTKRKVDIRAINIILLKYYLTLKFISPLITTVFNTDNL